MSYFNELVELELVHGYGTFPAADAVSDHHGPGLYEVFSKRCPVDVLPDVRSGLVAKLIIAKIERVREREREGLFLTLNFSHTAVLNMKNG